MAVDATDPTPASFKGAEAPGVEVSLAPGAYSVSETGGPDGYTGSFSAGCSGTIALGQTKTCTVTNDDQPAKLIVRKVVINDDGGTKTAADFSFEVNGGNATAFEADGQNDLTVDAGSYSITEPAAAGYTTSYDNCDNVALANGETKTCTITNNDQPAKLIVKKIVINDNGGTKTAADFSFEVNGGSRDLVRGRRPERPHRQRRQLLGHRARSRRLHHHLRQLQRAGARERRRSDLHDHERRPAREADRPEDRDQRQRRHQDGSRLLVHGQRRQRDPFEADGQNDLTVNAGSYSVTEPAAAGYTTSYDNCSELTLANGATATCTITNNDQPAKLIVKKIVINDNGGTKTAGDFTLAVNADSATPASFAGSTQRRDGLPAPGRLLRQRDRRGGWLHSQPLRGLCRHDRTGRDEDLRRHERRRRESAPTGASDAAGDPDAAGHSGAAGTSDRSRDHEARPARSRDGRRADHLHADRAEQRPGYRHRGRRGRPAARQCVVRRRQDDPGHLHGRHPRPV